RSDVRAAARGRPRGRILDVGRAQSRGGESLPARGDGPGALAYISPERLRGDGAGPAADVWAVGVLLWEALSGRHPFWTSSLLKTAERIQAGVPSLAGERPDLPEEVVQLVDSALALDPAARPPAA